MIQVRSSSEPAASSRSPLALAIFESLTLLGAGRATTAVAHLFTLLSDHLDDPELNRYKLPIRNYAQNLLSLVAEAQQPVQSPFS